VLGFLVLVCGVGSYDALHWLLHGPASGGMQRELPLDSASLLRGRTTSTAEGNLQNGSVFAARVRPWWNEMRLRAFGDAGRNVVAGRDGWLFLSSDLRPPRETRSLQRETAAHVEAGALALRSRGTAMLLVVVPDKSTLAVAELPPGFSAPPPSYAALIDELRGRGIDAPDLLAWMQDGPDVHWYRRDDTHWTLAGVERIALLLACRVRARCGTNAAAPPAIETRLLPWPAFRGIRPDLLNSLAITPGAALWNEHVDPEFGRVLGAPRGSIPPSLALAGTSMSFKQLREQLSSELGVEIANYAQAGAGSSGKFVELLLDVAAGRIPAPRLVLWETVERYGRESPCQTFATLPAALAVCYANQWQPWAPLPTSASLQRNLVTLARPPLEGEPLPQRTDLWNVRRFEWVDPPSRTEALAPSSAEPSAVAGGLARLGSRSGFVLPANGTFAVAFEAAGNGLALVGPGFANREWTHAIQQHWSHGPIRLPMIGADWITHFDVALRSDDREPQPAAWRIESAWREVGPCQVQSMPGRERIDCGLAASEPLVLDGTHALQFEIDSVEAGVGTLRAPSGAALEFPLPRGRCSCVIPLRFGVEWTPGLSTGTDGFARATSLELELSTLSKLGPRVVRLALRP
jgi:hypothetical protein